MESGYWQLLVYEEAQERLGLFTLDGNLRWKVMHMGALNESPILVAMIMNLQK